MSNRDLTLAVRLYTDASRFVSGLTQSESRVRRFGGAVRREFDSIRDAARSAQGQLVQLGIGFSVVATAAQSARMDKSLTQIGQTAAGSKAEVDNLRRELFRMGAETGQAIDDLQGGFNNAVQSGLAMREALPVIDATNKAMAVTGASADRLTAGLTVAGQAFQFDLAKPGQALLLLDKMTVAGRLGNAELQNLSDIFARVGVNAQSAGMGFDQTLAFIETLSLVERQPERLSTLADSTLRLFTNLKYMKTAATATGVRFFDQMTGDRRDPVEVLKDIKAKYDKLTTDKSRAIFLQTAFEGADLDTIKGLKMLLGSDLLNKISQFERSVNGAAGTLQRNLPGALSNAVDQAGRVKNLLREAADDFARPINDTLQNIIQWGLDSKENGGLGLNGKDILAGGAAGLAGLFVAGRYGAKGLGALASRFGGTAVGVAEGKALQQIAGVTPVYVVNMPGSLPGLPPGAGAAGGAGAGAAGSSAWRLAGTASLAAAPLAAMWGISNWAGDTSNDIGRVDGINGVSGALKRVLGWMGFDKDTTFARRLEANRAELNGEIRIRVDQDSRVTSVQARSSNSGLPFKTDVGYNMVAP